MNPSWRRFRWTALVASAVLASITVPTYPGRAADAAIQTEPNVVVIMLDDARYDNMSTLPEIRTRIGDQGATFRHFYASFPLCCPARASLFLGEYPHNHGVLSNTAPTGGFNAFPDGSTLATWLDPVYRTGLIGKYFNEYVPPYTPPGWDEWMVPKGVFNYTNPKWYINKGLGGSTVDYPGLQTDTMGALAADFIGRNAPSDQPFFLDVNIVAPHNGNPADPDDLSGFPTPYVKPTYRDRFKGMANTDPSFNEADVSDKPLKPALLSSAEITGLTETNAQRREAALSAQDATNQILNALEASGEMGNTYVILSSDNGYILGEHRIRGGKVAPYEVAARLPFMISGPGVTPGTTVDAVSAQIDVAPTVMDMANLPIPESVDGHSLVGLAEQTAADTRPAVVIEATDTRPGPNPLPWLYHGVVTPGWKYVERETGRKELYDLANDPYELVNVAGKPAYADTQLRMAALLTQYKWCAAAACR